MIHKHPHKHSIAKAQVGWWGQCQGPGHGERFALLYPRELAEDNVSTAAQVLQWFFVFFAGWSFGVVWTFHQSLQTLTFFFVATQGHQRNSSSGAKTAGTFDGFGAQKVPWGSFPAKHGWFWRHFGSDLYLPRCYNCQGALVKGERLWLGNGRLWDRSQLSLRSSKHIKGEDVEGWGLVIGGSQPPSARPPRVATMHHRWGWMQKGGVFPWGWKTVFCLSKKDK